MGEGNSAGASARAEYDKRFVRHKEAARRRRPYLLSLAAVLAIAALTLLNVKTLLDVPDIEAFYATLAGWLAIVLAVSAVTAAFATPGHVRAWSIGADGEERTGRLLAPLEADGFRVLHDRRIPMSRANIDHIVIGPSGVFVVESKSFAGRLRVRGSDVYVQGRRKTAMIDEVRREAAAVEVALRDELTARGLSVTPIICVHRAELPFFGARVDGIPIVNGKDLVRRLRMAKSVLAPADVQLLARLAEERLRSAT